MTDWARIIGAALQGGGETWERMDRLRQAKKEHDDELELQRTRVRNEENARQTATLERANEQANKIRGLYSQGRMTRSMIEGASAGNPTLKNLALSMSSLDDRAVGESGLDPDRLAQLIRDTRPAPPKPTRWGKATGYDPKANEEYDLQYDEDNPTAKPLEIPGTRRRRAPTGSGGLEAERGMRIDEMRRKAREEFADRMMGVFDQQGGVNDPSKWDPSDIAEAKRLGVRPTDYTAAAERRKLKTRSAQTLMIDGEPFQRNAAGRLERVPMADDAPPSGAPPADPNDAEYRAYAATLAAIDKSSAPEERKAQVRQQAQARYWQNKRGGR